MGLFNSRLSKQIDEVCNRFEKVWLATFAFEDEILALSERGAKYSEKAIRYTTNIAEMAKDKSIPSEIIDKYFQNAETLANLAKANKPAYTDTIYKNRETIDKVRDSKEEVVKYLTYFRDHKKDYYLCVIKLKEMELLLDECVKLNEIIKQRIELGRKGWEEIISYYNTLIE